MAITWGAPLTASNGWQVRTGFEVVETSSTATTYTVTRRQVMQSLWPLESRVNVGASGAGASTFSVSDVPFSSMSSDGAWSSAPVRMVRGNWSQTFTRQYGAAQSLPFTLTVSSIYGIPGTAKVSGVVTVPARPYNAPAAPSGVQVTRKSDGQHAINWTRNSPGDVAAPYTRVVVQRWAETTGAYSTVATTGNVSTFTDTGTAARNRYRWRVRAENSGGVSAWAYSPYVYTTPEAPSSVKATKQGEDILVTWKAPASPHAGYRLAYRDGSGAIQYPGWSTSSTSYLVKAPDPAVTHTYYAASASGDLLSTFVASNVVQLQAAPLAPSALAPAIVDAEHGATLSWSHNPVDTTDQTAREIQWRLKGAGTAWNTIAKADTTATTYTLAAGEWPEGTVEWQVRTWGAHADPSQWSATMLTAVTRPPSVTITSPSEGSFNSSRMVARWTFYDPEGSAQRAARVVLRDADGAVLWSKTVTGTGTALTVGRTLEDGAAYTLAVQAQDAPGLWSEEATAAIQVAYLPPPAGVISATWVDETAAVVLAVDHPAAGTGQVEAVSCEVWRSVAGGEPVRIAADLPPSSTLVDPIPGASTVTRYWTISVSAEGATAESQTVDVAAPMDGWTYLNGGPGSSRVVRVKGGTELDMDMDTDVEFFDVAGGDGAPFTVTSDRYREVDRVSVRLAPTVGGGATLEDLKAFIREVRVPILYRAPTGARRWVAVSGLSGAARGPIRTASFKVTTVAAPAEGV